MQSLNWKITNKTNIVFVVVLENWNKLKLIILFLNDKLKGSRNEESKAPTGLLFKIL